MVLLHYIDGNYTVLPEVVETSLGPYMQSMPRPRGQMLLVFYFVNSNFTHPLKSGTGGIRMVDLGLTEDFDDNSKIGGTLDVCTSVHSDGYPGVPSLCPRKHRMSERDAAFGLNTSVGMGTYLVIMGSRRDVVTAVWKTGLDGIWYKCMRCLRQTYAFTSPGTAASSNQNERETWWISRWVHGCPMCGGAWVYEGPPSCSIL